MRRSSRVLLGFVALLGACAGGSDRPDPSAYVSENPRPPEDGGGFDVTPTPCWEFCGETFLHEVLEPRNLYFVIDRSGSMGETVEGSSRSKYQTARGVIAELLRAIGHRVHYGAAVFPSFENPTECVPGQQIFPATLGTLPACDGGEDPLLVEFTRRLGSFLPEGGTPTALTLESLLPELEALEGETSVVLVTDGAPNCNLEASCSADECTLNIEGSRIGNHNCAGGFNCCDPETVGEGANGYCVDAAETESKILDLAERGIFTYVIGMPGTEAYAGLLGRFAEAGGRPRSGEVTYYATTDEDELRDALYAIGTGVAVRCEIDLAAPPEDAALVNVYFDGELVPADPEEGWSWDGDQRIEVHGAACDRLRSGDVIDARAVFGCDTVVR